MKSPKSLFSMSSSKLGAFVFALAVVISTPTTLLAQDYPHASEDVLGMSFVGHQVSNLEQSIAFYEILDFQLAEQPSDWAVDEDVNKLGGTPGVESRTAVMTIQSSVSDIPFTFILREYRGVERQDWSGITSYNLLSNHIDLTVYDDVSPLLDKLESLNALTMPKVQGLSNEREYEGKRRYAFVQGPDGLVIEIFGKPTVQPGQTAPVVVSNSSANETNIDRFGKQSGFNHYAVNILDPDLAMDFYINVLDGDFPVLPSHAAEEDMNMMNGWYRQALTENTLRIELIRFALNDELTAPPINFVDINANYVGFQVSDIDTAYARAKAYGAITVSEGGTIVELSDRRAVLLRDSDVGGYIVLWEPK